MGRCRHTQGRRHCNPAEVPEQRAQVDPEPARHEELGDAREVLGEVVRGVNEEAREQRVPFSALVAVDLAAEIRRGQETSGDVR